MLTYIDQGLSSGTGLVSSVLAAGLLAAGSFGAFAVAMSLMIVAVGILRSMSGSLLLVMLPEASPDLAEEQRAGAYSLAAGLGALGGVVLMAAGLGLGGDLGRALLALAVVTPVVAIQDVYRHIALGSSRPGSACLSDTAWLLGSVAAFGLLRAVGRDDVGAAVWAAYLPAAFGLLVPSLRPHLPRVSAAASWVRTHHRACILLVGDFLLALSYGAVPLVLLSAANADLTLAGSVRAAQTVLGPLMILYAASSLYLQPIMARARREPSLIWSHLVRQSGLNVGIGICWVLVALFIPVEVGESLFGASWQGASDVVGLVGVGFVGIGVSTGPLTALRALLRFRHGLLAQAATSAVVWSMMLGVGLLMRRGTLVGFGLGNIIGAIVPFLVLRSVLPRPRSPERIKPEDNGWGPIS